jgi:hypothetical protein
MTYEIGDVIEIRPDPCLYLKAHGGKKGKIIPNTASTGYKVKLEDGTELCVNTNEFINHSFADRFIEEEG